MFGNNQIYFHTELFEVVTSVGYTVLHAYLFSLVHNLSESEQDGSVLYVWEDERVHKRHCRV